MNLQALRPPSANGEDARHQCVRGLAHAGGL